MQLYELVLVHIFTLLIVMLSIQLFFIHLNRYKNNPLFPSLALALYFLLLAINYLFIFLLRFPTEETNLALRTWIVPAGAAILDPFPPLFGSLFASYTINHRRGFLFAMPLVVLSVSSIIIIALNPLRVAEGPLGVAEWVAPPEAKLAMTTDLFVSALVCLYLAFYTLSIKDRNQRLKGLLLTAGFTMVTYLFHFEENFGTGTPIYLRRALMIASMAIIHMGFTYDSSGS